jgi:hypothetical protein
MARAICGLIPLEKQAFSIDMFLNTAKNKVFE